MVGVEVSSGKYVVGGGHLTLPLSMSHSDSATHPINMLPIRFLVALAAIYDNVLYVVQPPSANGGYITFGKTSTNATVWSKMEQETLEGIKILSNPISNITSDNTLWFKVKFMYSKSSIETNWQNIILHSKQMVQPTTSSTTNTCTASLIITIIQFIMFIISCIVIYYYITNRE